MQEQTNRQPHHKVKQRDQQSGNRVALNEFRRSVERAEKRGFFLLNPAAFFGLGMIDCPGRHITVDGQLFARHAVQREPRANLGHTSGTFGDDDEIHDQQHTKNDQPHEHRPAHDKHGEPVDDFTSG